MGHTSNYACYIQDDSTQNNLVYDGHALGCSICVDITVDVMDMLDQGLSLDDIRTEIDVVYSAFGPSNMPWWPSNPADQKSSTKVTVPEFAGYETT